MATIYDFSVKTIDGGTKSLADYRGEVLLVVNVATKCGFTPQLEGLEELQAKYHDQGFEVLGFPCNQFGAQAPGPDAEIEGFCRHTYGVKFPLFAKIDVNGDAADPLYTWLKSQGRGIVGDAVKWNFTKFLVDGEGNVVDRFAPTTAPDKLEKQIAKAFGASPSRFGACHHA